MTLLPYRYHPSTTKATMAKTKTVKRRIPANRVSAVKKKRGNPKEDEAFEKARGYPEDSDEMSKSDAKGGGKPGAKPSDDESSKGKLSNDSDDDLDDPLAELTKRRARRAASSQAGPAAKSKSKSGSEHELEDELYSATPEGPAKKKSTPTSEVGSKGSEPGKKHQPAIRVVRNKTGEKAPAGNMGNKI